ncbi:hypothetical protein COOONC_23842 [Cooperia oncophora]
MYRSLAGPAADRSGPGIEIPGPERSATELAVQPSSDEYEPMSQLLWIGGRQDPSTKKWSWSDGEPWSYTNWDLGEPNNSRARSTAYRCTTQFRLSTLACPALVVRNRETASGTNLACSTAVLNGEVGRYSGTWPGTQYPVVSAHLFSNIHPTLDSYPLALALRSQGPLCTSFMALG